MKSSILLIVVLTAMSLGCLAQSAQETGQASGCKPGNLSQSDAKTLEEMTSFLHDLKAAVARDDKQQVAGMARYPLAFSTAQDKVMIRSAQELVRKYDQIFTPQIKNLLAKQEAACISRVGAQGFTIGTGQIWFDKFPDGKVKLFTVTAVTYSNE